VPVIVRTITFGSESDGGNLDPDFIFEQQPSSEEEQVEEEEAAQNFDPLDLEGYYFSNTSKIKHHIILNC